jgi:hypothetical protein
MSWLVALPFLVLGLLLLQTAARRRSRIRAADSRARRLARRHALNDHAERVARLKVERQQRED